MCKFIIIIKLKGNGYGNEYTTATIQKREEEEADSVILCTSNSFHVKKCRVGCQSGLLTGYLVDDFSFKNKFIALHQQWIFHCLTKFNSVHSSILIIVFSFKQDYTIFRDS